MQNGLFLSKNALLSKEVCYNDAGKEAPPAPVISHWILDIKFFCVKTVSDKVIRHSFAYLSVQK